MRCSANISNKNGETAQDIRLDEYGDCLLHIACQWGDVDIVRYLTTDARCDLDIQSSLLNTPLHVACYEKNLSVIRFFLRQKCISKVFLKNKKCEINRDGNTPLHIACYQDIIRLLLEMRCSTNIPNKKGETAQDIPLN